MHYFHKRLFNRDKERNILILEIRPINHELPLSAKERTKRHDDKFMRL